LWRVSFFEVAAAGFAGFFVMVDGEMVAGGQSVKGP